MLIRSILWNKRWVRNSEKDSLLVLSNNHLKKVGNAHVYDGDAKNRKKILHYWREYCVPSEKKNKFCFSLQLNFTKVCLLFYRNHQCQKSNPLQRNVCSQKLNCTTKFTSIQTNVSLRSKSWSSDKDKMWSASTLIINIYINIE